MKAQIVATLKQLGLDQDIEYADLFVKYIDQLIYWNKAYNLTALKNKNDILINHLYDCLVLIPELRRLYADKTYKIIDIGSGAGLPGIIIAICMPQWQVVCVDAVGKKTAFIKQMQGLLGLTNLESIHARIEQLENLHADLIISRAFASLADFVNLSKSHLNPNGTYLAMKGHYPEAEVLQLEQSGKWRVNKVIDLSVPNLDAQRCLLLIDKIN